MSGSISPLVLDKPGVYAKTSLYNADPKNLLTGQYFPVNDTIVVDGNVLYVVANSNVNTLTFDLDPAYLSDSADGFGLSSVISYGNDQFRALYDTRTQPYTLNLDAMLYFYGGSPSKYQITRYPFTDNAVIISQSFDATGTFLSNQGTMQKVSTDSNIFTGNQCYISQTPNDNEELLMTVFNEAGMEVASVTLFAKEGQIVNDLATYQPKIVSIGFTANQMLSAGSCYLYEKQDISALGIQAILTYQDGTTRSIPIDGRQCILYGTEDFVAAYAGLRQSVLLKYFLSLDEVSAVTLNQGDGSISTTFNITVVANQLADPVKISVIPSWSAALNEYTLRYLYYTTSGKMMADITNQVTISSGSFVGTQYTTEQSFQISCDLSQVDTTTYPTTTTYVQNVSVRLRPTVALVRYTIRDAISSPYIYGMDSTSDRRPILFYDASKGQHFISSSLFPSQAAFMKSFFFDANPPYDPNLDTQPVTPTHFTVRDPYRGVLVLPSPIPLASYQQAMSLVLTATTAGYVGGTLVIEFLQINGSTTSIVYGVPVDVYAGTYA